MDIAQLTQLPLVVLVIVGAYWVIQRINDEHAKQIVALTAGFLEKYEQHIKRAEEEREESRQRWIERDKQWIALLIDVKDSTHRHWLEVKEALLSDATQNHELRKQLTPLLLWWESEGKNASARRVQRASGQDESGTTHAAS